MDSVAAYVAKVRRDIDESPWIIFSEIQFQQVDEWDVYIKGRLFLFGGLVLHVAEYSQIAKGDFHPLKYRFQLQDSQNRLIRRWDNAPHHPEISTHPNHCHPPDGKTEPSDPMDILKILDKIIHFADLDG